MRGHGPSSVLRCTCFGGQRSAGYGFELEQTNLSVAASINGTELSWAFGAMLYSANKLRWTLQQTDQPCISLALFWGTSAALVAVISVLLLVLLRLNRQLTPANSDRGYVVHRDSV